jgi:hypothetical protein
MLQHFVGTFFMPLSPGSTLLTSALWGLLTTNAPGYCSTSLLAHPLSLERQHSAAQLLESAALPLAAVQPVAGHMLAPGAIERLTGR